MPFLILFILVPIAEVYVFLAVGDEIGIFKTLLMCVLTAIIGGLLVKKQGMETLFNAQQSMNGGKLPVQQIFDGFCLMLAGALLLTPGFVTDFAGFSLLIPTFRHFLREKLSQSSKFKVHVTGQSRHNASYNDSDIIDGDYETVEPHKTEIENSTKNDNKEK